jgi:hypothetical protein
MKTTIEMAREAAGDDWGLFQEYMPEIHRLVELVRADEREACSRVKAAKPRKLKPVGSGSLLDEQQFCFDKGWREGAASVRSAIRARSNT